MCPPDEVEPNLLAQDMTQTDSGVQDDTGKLHHEALIYESDDAFLQRAVPFLRDGVAAGEPTLVGVNPRLRQLLREQLGPQPRMTLLGADHYHDPVEALRQTAALHTSHRRAGAARIRVLGGIPQDPWPDWLRYEASVNGLLGQCSIWGMCPYDARCTSDEILEDVERTHPHLTSGRGRRVAFTDPIELINGRNCAAGHHRQATQPDVDLTDPSAASARGVLAAAAARTMLSDPDIDALCLCVSALLANAHTHGRPPVRVQAWLSVDCVDVMVRDSGQGPADPLIGLLPRTDSRHDDPGTMHTIYRAVSSVALFTDGDGFTVWLTQRATC